MAKSIQVQDPDDPLARRPRETAKSYYRFRQYVALGPARSLGKLADATKGPQYAPSLRKWSAKFDWVARAKAYDRAQLKKSIERRNEDREHARQKLVEDLDDAARTIIDLREGKIPENAERYTEGKKKGELVVKPATMLQAALAVLGLSGLTMPKRVEITGPDGREIQVQARAAIRTLSQIQIQALIATLDPNGKSEKPPSDPEQD